MYTLPTKKWLGHLHMPDRHHLAFWFARLVHDERFWPIVIVLVLMAMIVLFSIIAVKTSNPAAIDAVEPFLYYQ